VAIQFKRISCAEAKELIPETMYQKVIAEIQWGRLRAHLRDCDECRHYWERIWQKILAIKLKKILEDGGIIHRTFNLIDFNPCIREEFLKEYLAGQVTADEKKFIQAHLKECSLCSESLADLRK
jgi:predicted anti-sigma-YlaC factor YlaD